MERKVSKDGKWGYHDTPYLVCYKPSGMFYLRRRFGQRTILQKLDTTLISEARARIPHKLVELAHTYADPEVERDLPRPPKGEPLKSDLMASLPKSTNLNGGTKFSEAAALYMDETNSDPTISEVTKCHAAAITRGILSKWTDLSARRLDEIDLDSLRKFFSVIGAKGSATHYNAIRHGMLRICQIMSDRDARLGLPLRPNPVTGIRRLGVRMNPPVLPTSDQFRALLDYFDKAPKAERVAFVVRVCAYLGLRQMELRSLRWGDVDLAQKQVRVLCAKRRRRTSAGAVYRYVPMIPDAVKFFSHWVETLRPFPNDPVVPCCARFGRQLEIACEAIGAPRLKAHDLRHYFATRCIEAGVDIPTVARWLGHLDGGVLALRVYGHLRNEHSQNQAAKIKLAESHEYNRTDRGTPNKTDPAKPSGDAGAATPGGGDRSRNADVRGGGASPGAPSRPPAISVISPFV